MIPANNKIIVRCNMQQKGYMKMGDAILKMATLYEVNYRERSPVIAEVIDGNDQIRNGDIIIAHHNTFYAPSPFYLYDDLFSIPINRIIFGKIDLSGDFIPMCDNMIVERIKIENQFSLPSQNKSHYQDRYLVKDPGWTNYKPDQLIFTTYMAGYEIVYIWQNIEKRVVKVHSGAVCGYLK